LLTAVVLIRPSHTQAATAAEKRELTPADAVSTVRVIENKLALGERVDSGVTSPDGKRYLLRLIHGDVERNGVWMDLLTGSLESLESARKPSPCSHVLPPGRVFGKGPASADADADPANLIHWINDTQVA